MLDPLSPCVPASGLCLMLLKFRQYLGAGRPIAGVSTREADTVIRQQEVETGALPSVSVPPAQVSVEAFQKLIESPFKSLAPFLLRLQPFFLRFQSPVVGIQSLAL